MEIAIVVVAIITSLLWLLYQVGGAEAVIILIVLLIYILIFVLIFVGYKFLHSGKNSKKYYEDSEYIKKAMQFMEFYETIPCDHYLVITEYNIGIVINNKALGEAVRYHKSDEPATKPETLYHPNPYLNLLETLRRLTGEKGVTLYQEWKLLTKLDPHDTYSHHSVFYTSLALPYQDKEKKGILRYANALERQYRKTYHKNLQLCIWENNRILNI